MRLRLPFALLACLAPVASAAAQRVRGEVLLNDSVTRAAGVIVLVSSAGGEPVARALTNERGGFDVALPRPGRYRLRLLRIGYRPTDVPAFDMAAAELRELRIVLSRDAVSLSRVTVRGERNCRVRQDSGQLVARAWEEARKAITASQLSAGAPLTAEWIEFERTLDAAGRSVRRQTVRTTRNLTTHAFASLAAESLSSAGYVVAEGDGARYYAPDAEVLLSESFAAAHCFHMEPAPAGEANLIGVGFRPARDRDGVRDVEGTFWLDRESAELRRLEYRYTGLHAVATDAGAGGRVEFLRLPGGSWLINRWNIRMPRLVATAGRVRNPFVTVLTSGQPRVQGIEVAGGEVTLVLRGDTVMHRASGATLLARVSSRDTLIGVSSGTLTVDGTNYSISGDSAGLFRLSPVLTGRYHVRVNTAALDAIGAAPAEFDIEVRDGEPRETALALPPATELFRSACGEQAVRKGEGQLRGTVRNAQGDPVYDARVTVSWQASFENLAGGGFTSANEFRDVVTDGLGRWRLCGVPRRTPLAARLAERPDADHPDVPSSRVRLDEDQLFAEVHLFTAVSTPAAGATLAPGSMEIIVSDRAGHPLPNAAVEVIAGGPPLKPLRTDSTGRTTLARVPSGRAELLVRRIGYRAGSLAVEVEPGRNTVPVVLDKSAVPRLDTVRIRGDRRVSSRLDEFETRRIRGEATASISRAEIEKWNPVVVSQLLRNMPSVTIRDSVGRAKVVSNRGLVHKQGTLRMTPCYMRVMIDGIMLPPEADIDAISVKDVHGIEVFGGASSMPFQYTSFIDGWCGLVAIWTRDR